MTGTLWHLAAAAGTFVGGHFALSMIPVRTRLVAAVGELPFLGLYSVVAASALGWMVWAFVAAPPVALWAPPAGFRHLAVTVMPLVCILIACGYATPNPTAVAVGSHGSIAGGATGIIKVTRHPVMWGIALWAIVHGLANGDAAAVLFFGGFALLALGGAAHLDRRKRARDPVAWDAFVATAPFVPMAAVLAGRTRVSLGEIGWWRIGAGLALYAILLGLHEPVLGVSPLPLSG